MNELNNYVEKEKKEWKSPTIYYISFKQTKDGDIPGLEEDTEGTVTVISP